MISVLNVSCLPTRDCPVGTVACTERVSVFTIFHLTFVSGCDCVLAHNPTVQAHRRSLATSGVLEHFGGSFVSFGLRIVNARRTVGIVQFVDPFSVVPTENCSIVWICHSSFGVVAIGIAVGATKISSYPAHGMRRELGCTDHRGCG